MQTLTYEPQKRLLPNERDALTKMAELAGVTVDNFIDAVLRNAISRSVLEGKLAPEKPTPTQEAR